MSAAVSAASGVAVVTSAYPSMQAATVWIGVGVIVILLAGNLRGVRQAGAMFVVPRSSEDVQRRRAAVPRRHRNGPAKASRVWAPLAHSAVRSANDGSATRDSW